MEQQSKSTWFFPVDLTSEILLRLPAKSVQRFRCVSKLWSSITTDPCFIKSFETRSLTRPSLLLCLNKGANLFVSSIPQHTHQDANRSYSSCQHIPTGYHMKLPGKHRYLPPIEPVHGLVCFEESRTLVVWNPSTRQLLKLPEPKMSSNHIITYFGYDPVEGKHKVVCVPYKKTCYVCRVFTLGSGQESWRTVKTYHKHRASPDTPGRCIKGVIYYLADNCKTYDSVIMSFDVRSEKFHMIKLPSDLDWGVDVLITYKGRFACADRSNETRLWMLEDAEKHKWSFQDFDPSLYYLFNINRSTHGGEFIDFSHTFILFYDPTRNSCRALRLEGIAAESGYELNVFPNHIENLMSL